MRTECRTFSASDLCMHSYVSVARNWFDLLSIKQNLEHQFVAIMIWFNGRKAEFSISFSCVT